MSFSDVELSRQSVWPGQWSQTREYGSEYELAMDRLDWFYDGIRLGDTVDIVGVLADVKPASVVSYNPELLDVLWKLDLSTCPFGYEPGLVERMTVSKDQHLAEELADLFVNNYDGEDRNREIGTLLGYPASATEYFVKRRLTLEKDSELPMVIPADLTGTVRKEFCQFNLSPENWREEVEKYAVPLEEAVRNLTPETYRRIERGVKGQKIARNVITPFGIRSSSPQGVKIHYVS
jgi:hypothetical protein